MIGYVFFLFLKLRTCGFLFVSLFCHWKVHGTSVSRNFILNEMLETFYIIAFFYINAKKGCYTAFLILWKESLNSDGQQFHQYQQNDQSPLTEHKKTLLTTYDVGNPCSGLEQAYRYGGFKPVNGIPTNLGKKGFVQ